MAIVGISIPARTRCCWSSIPVMSGICSRQSGTGKDFSTMNQENLPPICTSPPGTRKHRAKATMICERPHHRPRLPHMCAISTFADYSVRKSNRRSGYPTIGLMDDCTLACRRYMARILSEDTILVAGLRRSPLLAPGGQLLR